MRSSMGCFGSGKDSKVDQAERLFSIVFVFVNTSIVHYLKSKK